MYAVFFDGTSHFVENENFEVDSDTEIVFRASDKTKCDEACDQFNNEL